MIDTALEMHPLILGKLWEDVGHFSKRSESVVNLAQDIDHSGRQNDMQYMGQGGRLQGHMVLKLS